MFGLSKPKLPLSSERQQWIDSSFLRLASILGRERLFQSTVILPTPEHFPDFFDASEAALQLMFQRIATCMHVDPATVDVSLFASDHDLTHSLVPLHSGENSAPAGLYYDDPATRPHISINEIQLKDPMSLVATLAHEIGHIILLRPKLVAVDEPEMEPLNDLLTIYLGFGIFTANASFRFEQHNTDRTHGWSAKRSGYLTEQQIGYALARFAYERRDLKPRWLPQVTSNIRSFTKQSLKWLTTHHSPHLLSQTEDGQ